MVKKRKRALTEKQQKTKELMKRGCPVKVAMELAGYNKTTINAHYAKYRQLIDDVDELKRVLKPMSAVANMLAIETLQDEMWKKDGKYRVKAAEVAVKNAKLHLGEDKIPPSIVFKFQTIDNKTIEIHQDKVNGKDEEEED